MARNHYSGFVKKVTYQNAVQNNCTKDVPVMIPNKSGFSIRRNVEDWQYFSTTQVINFTGSSVSRCNNRGSSNGVHNHNGR